MTGYTGQLIAARAAERAAALAAAYTSSHALTEQAPVIVAGRDARTVQPIADTYGFPARVASLDDSSALDAMLTGVQVVLHCAGPFSRTWQPMVEACLRNTVHYLDITGELQVFEAIAARDADARAAGIMLMPGTGFDVVPSDCLAAHLHRRLPSATSLALGFRALGGMSRGTALTMVENLGRSGWVRRDGQIVPVPPGWHSRTIDFGDGATLAVTIPWGDVSTAFHSTGIQNVAVYMSMHPKQLRTLRRSRWLGWLLRSRFVQQRLQAKVRAGKAGPSDSARARGASLLWGEARDNSGRTVISRLRGPEGYTLTAETAVRIAERVLAGDAPVGFQTPSLAYGADFILEVPGVERHDDAPATHSG